MSILKTTEFWYWFIGLAVSSIVAYRIFILSKNTNEEKAHLLDLFKENQRLSTNLQTDLAKYIFDFDASNKLAFADSNISLGTYHSMLIEEYELKLSDQLYNYIKSEKMSKPTLISRIESLNKQNEVLRMLELDMKLLIRKSNDNTFFVI